MSLSASRPSAAKPVISRDLTEDEPREESLRVFALRGAVQAERNDRDAILAATEELVDELLVRNGLRIEPERMISCIFTVTDDLDAEFPAVAARGVGMSSVPLLCTREIAVPGSLERVIRAMLHYHAPAGHTPVHIYLGAAAALRSDLASAQ